MKQFSCPDCKVEMNTCEGCQRYCSKEKITNILPEHPSLVEFWPPYFSREPHGYECCRGCSNNPANGGSGICSCTLPYFERGTTYNTTNTTTTTSQTFLINNTTDNGENV